MAGNSIDRQITNAVVNWRKHSTALTVPSLSQLLFTRKAQKIVYIQPPPRLALPLSLSLPLLRSFFLEFSAFDSSDYNFEATN